jgi:tetratricopeptide (TPR) repeat protein
VELDPEAPGVWLNIGAIQLARKRYTEAAQAFERERAINPTLVGLHRNLGLVARADGRWLEAAQYFLEELRLNPLDGRTAYHLADVWHLAGRPEQARQAAELARVLAPGDPAVAELLSALDRGRSGRP